MQAAIIGKRTMNTSEGKYIDYLKDTVYEFSSEHTELTLNNKFTFLKVDRENNSTVLSGVDFYIYSDSAGEDFIEKITTNRFGKAEAANLIFGETYYYREVSAPKGYERSDDLVPFTVRAANELLTVENTKLTGTVTLRKYDKDDDHEEIADKIALQGAEYQLYTANGTLVMTDESYNYDTNGSTDTFVTDDQGLITVTGLPWGSYYFIETAAPTGYELDENKVSFIIDKSLDDGSAGLTALKVNVAQGDSEMTASLIISKTDSVDGSPLYKTWYNLERKNSVTGDWNIVRSGLCTDVIGEIRVDGLIFGEYRFVEINPTTGYDLNTATYPETITLNAETAYYDDEDTAKFLSFTQTNDRKTGSAALTKYLTGDESIVIGGAKYSLYMKNTEGGEDFFLGNFTTDSNGRLVFNPIAIDIENRYYKDGLEWGEYYYVETYAPKGYVKSDEKITFRIDENNVDIPQEIKAYDDRKLGTVELTKKNEEGEVVSGTSEDMKATFDLYLVGEKSNTKVGTYTTDENGVINVGNLVWGKYFFKEIKAPQGYALASDKYFTVNASSCMFTQEIDCTDEKLKARIVIDKEFDEIIEDFGSPTFMFRVTNTNDNTFYTAAMTEFTQQDDGKYIGSVEFNVPVGSYKIEELDVSRYKLIEAEIIDVIGGTANIEDDNTATCAFTTEGSAEVKFTNEISHYDKFSHTVSVINQVEKEKQIVGMAVEYPYIVPVDDENGTYTIKKEDLIVSFMYDDGTEEVVYDKAHDIETININDLKCTEKNGETVSSGEFTVDCKTSDAGTVQSFTAAYDNGRTYKTMFDVTVGAPQTDIVKKVTFKVDSENILYFTKANKHVSANIAYFNTTGVVTGEYKIPVSAVFGKAFENWTAEDGSILNDYGEIIDYIYASDKSEFTLTANAVDATYTFDYTGAVQEFTAPVSGYYKLETWGAQGGDSIYAAGDKDVPIYDVDVVNPGGKGGYSYGQVYLEKGQTIYISVGGKGGTQTNAKLNQYLNNGQNLTSELAVAGWNGGGEPRWNSEHGKPGFEVYYNGGGATSIQLTLDKDGQLKNYVNDKDNVLLVAGGGGGSSAFYAGGGGWYHYGSGGSGGGETGGSNYNAYRCNENQERYDYRYVTGGTQEGPGKVNTDTTNNNWDSGSAGFGQGGSGSAQGASVPIYAPGGGCWYGGAASYFSGGGGGSGYVNTEKLRSDADKGTIGGNNNEVWENYVNDGDNSKNGNEGDGFAKITLMEAGELKPYITCSSGYGQSNYIKITGFEMKDESYTVECEFADGGTSTQWQTIFANYSNSEECKLYRLLLCKNNYLNYTANTIFGYPYQKAGIPLNSGVVAENGVIHKFIVNQDGYLLDGKLTTYKDTNNPTVTQRTGLDAKNNSYLTLFNQCDNMCPFLGKIYYLKVYRYDELVLDLVPATDPSSGNVGFFDNVSNNYYTSTKCQYNVDFVPAE